MLRTPALRAAWLGGLVLSALPAAAQQGPTPLATVIVAQLPGNTVFVTAPRNDFRRAFIVAQSGTIHLLDITTDTLQGTPFLTVSPMSAGGERGLLGLAFHPDYESNGYFWVYHNVPTGAAVARYRAIGDPLSATAADPASRLEVLHIPGLLGNHNAGWIGFGADGHLYVFTGDGGISSRAQDITDQLAGKLLRLDVDGPDNIPGNDDDDGFPADATRHYTIPPDNPFVGVTGDDEIWAYGLRNPWRDDIDPVTGDLFIADVGAGLWEEVSFQPVTAPGSMPGDPGYMGGRNYGWPTCEGFSGSGCPGQTIAPFVVYGHSQAVPPTNATGCSITGGVVYRGCAIPDLDGTYFFADYCSGRVFSLRYNGSVISDFQERTAQLDPPGTPSLGQPTGFGRDGWGEMYICGSGRVMRVVAATPTDDVNGDGVADTCRCPADWDGNAVANSTDISAFLTAWVEAVTGGTGGADYDRSGTTDSSDISAFLTSWLAAQEGGC